MSGGDHGDGDADLGVLGLPTSFVGRGPKRRRRRPNHPPSKRPRRAPRQAPCAADLALVVHRVPFDLRLCVAPMVGVSDLAFRTLCRRNGATCVWTEMFRADHFAFDENYRNTMFSTHEGDRPLVVQLCANNAAVITRAALLAEPHCDCVEVNLGCPQRGARVECYGAYLTLRQNWPKVFAMVKSLTAALKVPVACKIRLQPTVEETIEFCRLLHICGCAFVTVHGRHLLSDHRKRRRHGPADLGAIKQVRDAVPMPVITNGNVRTQRDVVANLAFTGCVGIMCAEAVMANPALFDLSQRLTPTRLHSLALEYLALAEQFPPPSFDYARGHIRAMLRRKGGGMQMKSLLGPSPGEHEGWWGPSEAELRARLDGASSLQDLREIVESTVGRFQPRDSSQDDDARTVQQQGEDLAA